MDEVRRREAASTPELKAALKQPMHVLRMNPENLSAQEADRLETLDLKHLASGQAYLFRLELGDIYRRTVKPEQARYRLESSINWGRAKCDRLGESLPPMHKVANTIKKHLDRIFRTL